MAGHVVNGQLDAEQPASLSEPTVTGLLRGELGWDGVVVTDDLQAAAITKAFGRDEAILLALEAGNDLLLFANQQVYDPRIVTRVVDVVAAAVQGGRLTESRIDESLARVRATFGEKTGRGPAAVGLPASAPTSGRLGVELEGLDDRRRLGHLVIELGPLDRIRTKIATARVRPSARSSR